MKVPSGHLPLDEVFRLYYECRWRGLPPADSEPEGFERTDLAIRELRNAFERGDLEARVWDEDQGRELTLTPGQWRAAGFPERPFLGGLIADFSRGALADYAQMVPYTDRAMFDRWLAEQLGTYRPEKRAKGRRPESRVNARWALNQLYPNGLPDIKHAALVDEVNQKLTSSGKTPVSPDTVSRAIGKRSDRRETAE